MADRFSRTELVLGRAALERLQNSRVIVFGVGGVGGYCVEALARSGVGHIEIVDDDCIAPSNLNRQIIALESTIGRPKVEVMAERIHDINPDCEVVAHRMFFLPETQDRFDFAAYAYVVDCVDTVAAKLALIEACQKANTPILCAMGAGNKLDPTAFKVADLEKTSVDPLARVMRVQCRKRGFKHVRVVYSTESPVPPSPDSDRETVRAEGKAANRRSIPGSLAFVPSVMGLILAGEVVRALAKREP